MADTFKDAEPLLRMTSLTSVPEIDEQAGLKFLAMGGMRGLRNPRSHSDEEWWTDGSLEYVLDALSVASFLHRCLDHCQEYQKQINRQTGAR
jgi:uncharacterized protein (TIGR02391 family)